MEKVCGGGSAREGKVSSGVEEEGRPAEAVHDARTETGQNALRRAGKCASYILHSSHVDF